MKQDSRTEELREIKCEILNLKESPLYEYRKKNKFFPVIGQGSHYAEIMFIGEAPGLDEAKTGHPFVGKSGKILDKLFEQINLKREDIYISNVVKDRPPDNREPSEEEIKLYGPYLLRQIELIKPRKIVTLGRFPMEFIAKNFDLANQMTKISLSHGKIYITQASYGDILVIPQYHPATATYNINMYATLEKDFKMILKSID